MIFSDDAPALEAALHRAFEDKKLNMINTRREFFNVTLDEIKEVVKSNYDKTIEKERTTMPLPIEKFRTIKDIYSLPEGQRAELIDGDMYMMAPPSRIHQKLVMQLSRIISNYIADKGGSCEVYPAPFAVFLNADDENYVEPDISVICDHDKLNDKGCVGAPDWIIEIVSPSSQRMDYLTKLFKYRTAAVREYWIVDPQKELIQLYSFEDEEDFFSFSFNDTITSKIFQELSICIDDLLK